MTIRSLFDLHSDIPSAVLKNIPSAVSYPDSLERQIQVAALFVPESTKNPYTYYHNMLREFLLGDTPSINKLNEDKTVLLSLEGGISFEQDINRLYSMKRDGISSVSLTWNSDNSLAGGAKGFCGITKKGMSAIRIINELNLALDISHLNEKSAACGIESANVVLASHSNCKAVNSHPRNLSDELLLAIKEKQGIVGINFYPSFLPEGDVFSGIYENILHMLNLGMRNNISFGSDFDGGDMNDKLKNTEQIRSLYDFLFERFKDDELLSDIFFNNAYTFYKNLFDNQGFM